MPETRKKEACGSGGGRRGPDVSGAGSRRDGHKYSGDDDADDAGDPQRPGGVKRKQLPLGRREKEVGAVVEAGDSSSDAETPGAASSNGLRAVTGLHRMQRGRRTRSKEMITEVETEEHSGASRSEMAIISG